MNQLRPPLSTITPTKTKPLTGYKKKMKPTPIKKNMGIKRSVKEKIKIKKNNR